MILAGNTASFWTTIINHIWATKGPFASLTVPLACCKKVKLPLDYASHQIQQRKKSGERLTKISIHVLTFMSSLICHLFYFSLLSKTLIFVRVQFIDHLSVPCLINRLFMYATYSEC